MANVLLLRAPSSPIDRYETAFTRAGYDPVSIPVLETTFTNVESLKAIVEAGPAMENLDGVIMTSGRACEVWKKVVGELIASSPQSAPSEAAGWSSTPFYVVGQATASALAEVRQAYGKTNYTPEIIRGESSGTAERLAQVILEQLDDRPKKLLHLTGDKNRDAITIMLREVGVELRPLQVYETQGSRTFERDLEEVLRGSPLHIHHILNPENSPADSPASERCWIIHFAPSAAEFVTPILNRHLRRDSVGLKIAAIGPVTSSFLRDELKIHVDVVSPLPKPEVLVDAIVAYEKECGL